MNLGMGHRNVAAWIKYIKVKSDTNVPIYPAHPQVQKTKLCFIAFPHTLSGRIWFQFFDKSCQKYVTASMLCRSSLATLQPDIQNLALFIRPREQAGYKTNC